MIVPISRANYFLSIIKVIMRKFLPANCETVSVSVKNISISMWKVNYMSVINLRIYKKIQNSYIEICLFLEIEKMTNL